MMDLRLGYLEASVEQQNASFDGLYQQTVRIAQEMRSLGLRLGTKIGDGLARLDQKIDRLDHKFDRKFDDLRMELSKQFRWTVGLMVTTMGLMVTLIGLVAGLLTTAFR